MSFNTKIYDSTNTNYNANFDTYIMGNNNIPVDGNLYYNNKFGKIMTSFIVDSGDSVFGGNVLVSENLTIHGKGEFKNDLTIGGNVYIPGKIITPSTNLLSGPTGPIGPIGPIGLTGFTGSQGFIGATGSRGLAGSIGPTGVSGLIGSQGNPGATGATGATGQQGLPGVINTGITYTQLPVFTSNQVGFEISANAFNIPFNNYYTNRSPINLNLTCGVYIIEYSGVVFNNEGDTGFLNYGITSILDSFQIYSSEVLQQYIRFLKTIVVRVQNQTTFYLLFNTTDTSPIPFDHSVLITNCKMTATRIA